MLTNMIELSIIIPLYNQSQYIIPCLESMEGISVQDFEVIVWDDGSTDNSPSLVVEYAKNHENVRLVRRENHGVSYARSMALQEAKGKYVWFVDSDDMVITEHVKPLIEALEQHSADVMYFFWRAFDGYNYSTGVHEVENSVEPILGKELFMKRRLMMAPWCFIYRTDLLLEHNLCFDESYKTCEDILFNQKVLLFAKRVLTSCRVAYTYRLQSESASQGKGRSKKVLWDQIRRMESEIRYYVPLREYKYLFRVLSLNCRDIVHWMRLWIGAN